MYIERDGKKIQLTQDEMYSAYFITQNEFDQDDIVVEMYDCDREKAIAALGSELNLQLMAQQYRKYMDNEDRGDFKWDCMIDARDYILKKETA